VEGVGLSIAQRGGLKRLDEITARAGGHGARERVTLIRAQICPVGYAARLMVLRHKATNSNRHPEALGAHLCAPSLEGVTAPIRAASFEARAQSVAGLVIVILARGHLQDDGPGPSYGRDL
jgi:hypothetical protein